MTPTKNDTTSRVHRGGCWSYDVASWVRAESRFTGVPAVRDVVIGFRCALRGRVKR